MITIVNAKNDSDNCDVMIVVISPLLALVMTGRREARADLLQRWKGRAQEMTAFDPLITGRGNATRRRCVNGGGV